MEYQKIVLVREKELEYQVESTTDCAELIEKVFKPYEKPEEHLWLVCLNNKKDVVGLHEVSRGGLCCTVAGSSEIYKRALLNNAYAVILAHNHPSGDCEPSQEDMSTTRRLSEAGQLLGIKFLDHIVFGGDTWVSMKAAGLF